MTKISRMYKSFLARKKRKKTKVIIETLSKRKKAHALHQIEKILKFPNNYSERAKELIYKKLEVE